MPVHSALQPGGEGAMPLSGMLAGGTSRQRGVPFCKRRDASRWAAGVGLSLWRPGREVDWLQPDESEPALTYLPSRLWLIGLGHLGSGISVGTRLVALSRPR